MLMPHCAMAWLERCKGGVQYKKTDQLIFNLGGIDCCAVGSSHSPACDTVVFLLRGERGRVQTVVSVLTAMTRRRVDEERVRYRYSNRWRRAGSAIQTNYYQADRAPSLHADPGLSGISYSSIHSSSRRTHFGQQFFKNGRLYRLGCRMPDVGGSPRARYAEQMRAKSPTS